MLLEQLPQRELRNANHPHSWTPVNIKIVEIIHFITKKDNDNEIATEIVCIKSLEKKA